MTFLARWRALTNRLLWNEDGKTLDEIVYHGYVHVEQMDDDHYWMGVGESHFDFVAIKKGQLNLTGYDIDPKDFPLEQRHMNEEQTKAWNAAGRVDEGYITVRDDRTIKDKLDASAQWLAAMDGKGWKQLSVEQKAAYRRKVKA